MSNLSETLIENLLRSCIMHQDEYDDIYDFLTSFNIRSGEYEINDFVIKKMDQINVFIFLEYTYPEYPDCHRGIHVCTSIYKDNLVNTINAHAKKQGLVIKEE